MPSLVGLEPLIHIPFYQYNVPVGFYQYAVPGGTGTLASQTFLPIQRPCGVLPTCRPGGGYQHAVLAGATNMPSLAGFYQHAVPGGGYQYAVPGGTGTISFPVLLPIYRPWRDWNIPAFGLLPLLRLLWANWNAKNLDTSAWGWLKLFQQIQHNLKPAA